MGGEAAPPAPELAADLMWVWSAWHDLDPERGWIGGGMGAPIPGATPWTAVLRWAERRGLSEADTDFLVGMIRVLDAENTAHAVERGKR